MKNEILIYNLPDGESNVEVYLNEDDIWMTQLSLADMFQTSKANITMHIQNIYKEGELQEDRTSKWGLLLRDEGTKYSRRRNRVPRGEHGLHRRERSSSFRRETASSWHNLS